MNDGSLRLGNPILPDLAKYSQRLSEVWESGWLTNNGAQLRSLERRLGARLGAPELMLFCNGTVALLLALKALGITGEVITTPFTFPATIHAIQWAGLEPVFADIDYETLTLDPDAVSRGITSRTSAIMGVHVYGTPCHVDALASLSKQHDLRLVYDAAHAFDTKIQDVPISLFGDITMFSFHATKLFHTAEGGALAFSDPGLRARLALSHNFGISAEDEVPGTGINGKMSEVNAALGHCVLDCVDAEREARNRISNSLDTHLGEIAGLSPRKPPPGVNPSYQYYPVLFERAADRQAAWHSLRAGGVAARRYFYPLGSEFPAYRHLPSADPALLPVAGDVVQRILCLPCHSGMADSDPARIARLIAKSMAS